MKPIYNREFKPRPTMTVEELIEELKKYPSDLRVAAEWEDQYMEFDAENFRVSRDLDSPWPMLVITVDS